MEMLIKGGMIVTSTEKYVADVAIDKGNRRQGRLPGVHRQQSL